MTHAGPLSLPLTLIALGLLLVWLHRLSQRWYGRDSARPQEWMLYSGMGVAAVAHLIGRAGW